MNKQVVFYFAGAINSHDVDRICSMMTEEHTFVDAHGNRVEGRDKMKAGWNAYFQLFPDYHIELTDIFENNGTVAAFGFAGGTYKGYKTPNNQNYWRLPAAWKAIVEDGKIKLWQVYADTKVVFEVMGKNG
ncbi:nuclear transport factor 2 family protein [Mucilaginibacter gotjawali]|uniref:Ketosteroid isomerase-like protein n=2 Tax=Mucilaginibacter gotjawali TaxID=1550579 RepID=A0A839SE64_9SPHI|nr:nuclear transport factor 2 family protein [Mucilaginibacter gotjawali]MBB3055180.1 ketosteroid isomerase-like protein [Mucilaginibacter gotjawali]BAU56201.1 SnoaL-like domain protein [Mucilaginibacter gotjawali]